MKKIMKKVLGIKPLKCKECGKEMSIKILRAESVRVCRNKNCKFEGLLREETAP